MKFWLPLPTVEEVFLALEAAVARSAPPVKVKVERVGSNLLITLSRLGTSTLELSFMPKRGVPAEETAAVDGMEGLIVSEKISSLHKSFRVQILQWIEREIIGELGGKGFYGE